MPGIVTNVTAFGAFVDIGVHRDGLVHVSELSDRFVKDPREVVQVHQKVKVTILDLDLERGRVTLSMKSGRRMIAPARTEDGRRRTEDSGEADSASRPGKPAGREASKTGAQHTKNPAGERKGAFNNPFEKAFKDRD